MYDFIVLGLVPGTQIQITFYGWLYFAISLSIILITWKMHRQHVFRNTIISLAFLATSVRNLKSN